ncbi:hypothetical protein HDU84_006291 [Entophlyctis sp. JEL0112]|nr:hypothetical protein HDU84_006291 [Entophlyctis sp. JEL0112]
MTVAMPTPSPNDAASGSAGPRAPAPAPAAHAHNHLPPQPQHAAPPLFAAFFVTGRFADALLRVRVPALAVCEDVRVHRVVLAAQSSFFDALFAAAPVSPPSPQQFPLLPLFVVDLPRPSTASHFRAVLEWIYFGPSFAPRLSLLQAIPVLSLARFLALPALEARATAVLLSELSPTSPSLRDCPDVVWDRILEDATRANDELTLRRLIDCFCKFAKHSLPNSSEAFLAFSLINRVYHKCISFDDPIEPSKVQALLAFVDFSKFSQKELQELKDGTQSGKASISFLLPSISDFVFAVEASKNSEIAAAAVSAELTGATGDETIKPVAKSSTVKRLPLTENIFKPLSAPFVPTEHTEWIVQGSRTADEREISFPESGSNLPMPENTAICRESDDTSISNISNENEDPNISINSDSNNTMIFVGTSILMEETPKRQVIESQSKAVDIPSRNKILQQNDQKLLNRTQNDLPAYDVSQAQVTAVTNAADSIPRTKIKKRTKKVPATDELLDQVSERLHILIACGEVEESDTDDTSIVSFGQDFECHDVSLADISESSEKNASASPKPVDNESMIDSVSKSLWEYSDLFLRMTNKSFSLPPTSSSNEATNVNESFCDDSVIDDPSFAADLLIDRLEHNIQENSSMKEFRDSVGKRAEKDVLPASIYDHTAFTDASSVSETSSNCGREILQNNGGTKSAPVPPTRKLKYLPSQSSVIRSHIKESEELSNAADSDAFSWTSSPQSAQNFHVNPIAVTGVADRKGSSKLSQAIYEQPRHGQHVVFDPSAQVTPKPILDTSVRRSKENFQGSTQINSREPSVATDEKYHRSQVTSNQYGQISSRKCEDSLTSRSLPRDPMLSNQYQDAHRFPPPSQQVNPREPGPQTAPSGQRGRGIRERQSISSITWQQPEHHNATMHDSDFDNGDEISWHSGNDSRVGRGISKLFTLGKNSVKGWNEFVGSMGKK